MRMRTPLAAASVAAASAALLAGCTAQPQGEPMPVPSATSTPTPSATVDPLTLGPVQPTGAVSVLATGLAAPWSMVRLESGSTLVSERDTALIKELTAEGTLRDVGTIPGVDPGGEGGLLGIEVVDDELFAYFTSASDNRIVAFDLVGDAGGYSLAGGRDVVTGLAKASNHNGGRIKIGPDGMLYATVGDASQPGLAQDPVSYNGKILRMQLDGSAPPDNPIAGSLVYSLGHRNPQGLAWDTDGRLWAAEFGQDTWDEINLIVAGGNYGWPTVEGIGGDPAFVNPVAQWPTDDASPSGLAVVRETVFMAGLGGERLWGVYPGDPVTTASFFFDSYGRIRDVIAGPNGTLWMLTNNTDGRGDPRAGDDQILQVELAPLP